jgi:hypothetical protein
MPITTTVAKMNVPKSVIIAAASFLSQPGGPGGRVRAGRRHPSGFGTADRRE